MPNATLNNQPVVLLTQEEFEKLELRLTTAEQQLAKIIHLIQDTGQQITLQEFANRSGCTHHKIRSLINAGRLQFNQAQHKGRITLPISELLKMRQ